MIPIHFGRVLKHQGKGADDTERVYKSIALDLYVISSLEVLIYMQQLMRRLHVTRPVLETAE
jgi:hypothetical protein